MVGVVSIRWGLVLKGHNIAKFKDNCPKVFIVINAPRELWQCLHFIHEEGFEPMSVESSGLLQPLPGQVFSCHLALSRLCIYAVNKQLFELNA